MSTTKLQAWRDAELHQLATVLHDAWLAWQSAWGLAGTAARVSCVPAGAWGRQGWLPLGPDAAPGAWLHWSEGAQSRWQALFGEGVVSTTFTRESAAECADDGARRLARAILVEADAGYAEEAFNGKWCGAVQATLPCDSQMLIGASCIQRLLRRTRALDPPHRPQLPSLSPILEAVSSCETRVEARLADCALDLATLQGLQVGDVIRIPHALTQPVRVRVAGDLPVFDGFLARSGAYRALELLPASA